MGEEIAAREKGWQDRWEAAGLSRARARPGVPKFFGIFAYPGTSGFMHLGHMRGYSYSDMIARFHRMKGEEVFFPAGIHASGLPAIVFSSKVARRDPDVLEALEDHGVGPQGLSRLEDPAEAARFLGESYWRIWRRFGLLLDRSANVATIDPDYQQFIRWQFRKLREQGRLVQKPYFAAVCPRSGPVSVDPSETDLDRGGNAEITTYTALPFTLPDGRALLCATLRPETVYGVTNLWVAPQDRLQEWSWQGRTYLVSAATVGKLLEQWGGEKGATLRASDLLAGRVKAPLTGLSVPILESALVDPAVGTGVVMSVPAHAPADWVGVQELPQPLRGELTAQAKVLLALPSERLAASEKELFQGEGPPAAQVVRALGVHGLQDRERLAEATERVYRAEHRHGVMLVPPYQGESVERARTQVAEKAVAEAGALEVREFSEPVVCRCGETVVIRRIPDQWFLAYGDAGWKEQVREHLRDMRILPGDYAQELPAILDWFEDRPAVRQGRWLGTPFPEDPRWIIEPIADSTLYPAYFVVRRFVTDKRISAEQLTPSFFDFVFLGEGDGECSLPKELQEEVRREFLYFYPLDLNLGGKEHKRVHFPPFLYNHIALLPRELWPRGIFVHWWITGRSGKLSKKDVKGGAVPPVYGALDEWGADGIRLYMALSATPFQDVEWDAEACARASARATETLRLAQALFTGSEGVAGPPPPGEALQLTLPLDRWLSSVLSDQVAQARSAFESSDFREAAEVIYVRLPASLRRYRARGGENRALLARLARSWPRMLSPITPHLAEEAAAGHSEGLIAASRFPEPGEFARFPDALMREARVEGLEDDISSLLKSWKGTSPHLRIFVAAAWKGTAETRVRAALRAGTSPDLGSIMKVLRAEPELNAQMARLPELLKLLDLRALASSHLATAPVMGTDEELALWKEAADYLCERMSLQRVEVVSEEEGGPLDPKGRRGRATPGRPALYLVEGP